MPLTVPDEVLDSARITEEELRQEVAVLLFEKHRLTLAQASEFAGMTRPDFQHLLADRRIPVHYDVADLDEDIETLKRIGRL